MTSVACVLPDLGGAGTPCQAIWEEEWIRRAWFVRCGQAAPCRPISRERAITYSGRWAQAAVLHSPTSRELMIAGGRRYPLSVIPKHRVHPQGKRVRSMGGDDHNDEGFASGTRG